MTIALAIEYIPIWMKNFGHEFYDERPRQFVLQAGETKILESYNHFFILVDEFSNISITSYLGDYDLSNPAIDEQTYEHQGFISMTNNGSSPLRVRFIHLIPKE